MRLLSITFTCLVALLLPILAQGATIALPKTGQTLCYDFYGSVSCDNEDWIVSPSGQDGEVQAGIAWPVPRFADNGNGTITDNLTGLVWLANANCLDDLSWANALTWSKGLADGSCGLSDGSAAGEWRLPNRRELSSLVDRSKTRPSLPSGYNAFFTGVQYSGYWSSSTYASDAGHAWVVDMTAGNNYSPDKASGSQYHAWPVRGGQYTLTLSVSPTAGVNGSITPDTPQTVNSGDYTVFTVLPDIGYKINTVTGCGGFLNSNTYTTGAISSDCSVTATFVTVDADVDADKDGISDDIDNCPYDYNPGQENFDGDLLGDICDLDDDNDDYDYDEDCNDQDFNVNPGAIEVIYNGKDDDCNALTLDDDIDQDGYGIAVDCNDNDPAINPDAAEILYNSKDDDCNALTLDDDIDQDGYGIAVDCNDNDPAINPGAAESPYNSKDDDCNALTLDDDIDQDGYGISVDCNDNDAGINPGATEIKFDGLDQNCTGHDLTITIEKATYDSKKDILSVEATSNHDFSEGSALTLEGYGLMSSNNNKWTYEANPAGGNPVNVTVSGVEGAETVAVSLKDKTK